MSLRRLRYSINLRRLRSYAQLQAALTSVCRLRRRVFAGLALVGCAEEPLQAALRMLCAGRALPRRPMDRKIFAACRDTRCAGELFQAALAQTFASRACEPAPTTGAHIRFSNVFS